MGKIPPTHRSSQGADSRIGARVGECEIAPRTGEGEPTTGHIKKGIRHLGPRTEQLYEVIGIMEQDATYSRKELCLALGVSRIGRYNHLYKANKGRRQENERLGARIVELFEQSRGFYGWRRIQAMLRREGTRCGKERILRLMKRHGLRALQKRRFRPRTTQSRHEEPIAVNRLKGLRCL